MSDKPTAGNTGKDWPFGSKPQASDKPAATRGQSGGKNWSEEEDVTQADGGDTSIEKSSSKPSK
jgi:hypothetical protein